MNRTEFITGLKEQLEIEAKLTEHTNIKELDEWDSMNAMVLIAYVADNFGINLNAEDLKKITTINSLIEKIGIDKLD